MAMLFPVAVLVCIYGVPQEAWARSGGISGFSGNPSTCTSCHGGGTVPTVSLTGPTSLTAGASGVYTLTITGGAAVVGGLDVSTTSGTLQATGSNTTLLNGEITHSTPVSFTGGSLAFTFTAVAPPAAGAFTLFASGLSADGDGSTSGDNSAKTSLAVNVVAGTPAPQISLNPTALSLGSVVVGSSASANTLIHNTGTANLVVSSIALCAGTSSAYTWSPTAMPLTIAAGGSATLTVTYSPLIAGSASGCLNISSNDTTTPTAALNVSGTGTTTPVTFNVTPSAGANGSISPSTVQTVTANNTISFTVTPNSGYQTASVTGCGGALSGTLYTTGPITGNCGVSATFSPVQAATYSVTPSWGANGSILPSTTQTVTANGSALFTIMPNTGYHIASVTGCGGTLSGSVYTAGPVTSNCSVVALFSAVSGDPTPVGYSPLWLIVTFVSLVLVGGYLLRRKRKA
jgi:Abnormal spindle-like microcephaly-assoc'd, ASPM-SPD-2-Hydin